MTRGEGMTQVAMFPHVPDRSLGFSFGEVLHPSARFLMVADESSLKVSYVFSVLIQNDKLYWIIHIFTDTQILSISPKF